MLQQLPYSGFLGGGNRVRILVIVFREPDDQEKKTRKYHQSYMPLYQLLIWYLKAERMGLKITDKISKGNLEDGCLILKSEYFQGSL